MWPVPGWPGVMGQEGFALAIPGLMISKESSSLSLCRAHCSGFTRRGKRRGSSGPRGPISWWDGCGRTACLLPGLDWGQHPCSQPAVLHGQGAGCTQDWGARSPWIPTLLWPWGGEEDKERARWVLGMPGLGTRGKGVSRLPGGFWSGGVGSEVVRKEGWGKGKEGRSGWERGSKPGITEGRDQEGRGRGPGEEGRGTARGWELGKEGQGQGRRDASRTIWTANPVLVRPLGTDPCPQHPPGRVNPCGTLRVIPVPRCTMVEVTVTPQSSLADRPVQIRVRGLSPSQLVTLRAWLKDEQGECFQSRAFFRADGAGEVDPEVHAALGGSYSGVWPMGLFWFLQPDTLFRRLVKRDVAGSPFRVRLEVFDGLCLGMDPREQPLGSCEAERWYVGPGVQRVPIREGRVRGALFLPPGEH